MDDNIIWKIIDKYFVNNSNYLVAHQLDSFNDFITNGIKRIFKEKNPLRIMKNQDTITQDFNFKCELYLGGKSGDKLYFGKPIIHDESREHYMYPNEARLRNMTYGTTIHYDVEIDFHIKNGENVEHSTFNLEKIYLGKFPIMLNSKLCILNKMDRMVKFNMGECKNDVGGYFIIDGKEKVIISQEKFSDNMIYVKDKGNELYSHSAAIRSVSEDASKPIRTVSVKIVAPTSKHKNGQIVVEIPNVKKPIPLFIVMRALGVESDKDIIKYCLLDIDKYETYVDLFIPSIHNDERIFNQENALKYISTFTKIKTIPSTLHILMDYFLPHIGELNFQVKAYFLGHMVKELLLVYTKEQKPTDRDSFRFKRIELPGTLLYDLFKEYFTLQQKNILLKIDNEYYYKKTIYNNNFVSLIENNYKDFFATRIVEDGFKKAFKGNWGAEEHTKKVGIVQPINRLSHNSFLSHLRKINLPIDASAKIVGPRVLHGSQWGIIDPMDTPDGANIGTHKHLSITAKITSGCSGIPIINLLRNKYDMLLLQECSPKYLAQTTKVFVNGSWVGSIINPEEIIYNLKNDRRTSLISIFISIQWNIGKNELVIYTDSGRLCRPIFYIDEKTKIPSYNREGIIEKLKNNEFKWLDLITGFLDKTNPNFSIESSAIYSNSELYGNTPLDIININKSIIEYIDTSESETSLIAMNELNIINKFFTHIEIHPSLLLGILGNQIVFPENNQLPRDVFACGQIKQAVSLYHSNYQTRIDKMGVVLNYGQIPLIKSRFMKYINNEEHPYGENVVVAIGVFSGYNVEDSILFNEGSIQRGMFRTTYYTMYESFEETSKIGNVNVDSKFINIEKNEVIGIKPGYDYSGLDDYGLLQENTMINDTKVVIGKVIMSKNTTDAYVDASEFPKKGQVGYVDKSFITEGEEGFRIAKVRVREERIPGIGDKFCSRCGQKGTVGIIVPELDMPFTQDGIKPDIIINPHAIPSRMTIGQLLETVIGKACSIYGGFGDCTAFVNKADITSSFGKLLTDVGLHSSGNQILYNGQTGEQLTANIFIGPTYYMRLKHMVKDKINYRARGPRTVLTRQTVQGRANDGGLRIGEMERDGILAHGASMFIEESLMVRGDEYYMAICNQTGTVAIYNESLNLFLSPMADGPIKFTNIATHDANIVNISKYGREFSIVRVPYAFKLLLQELRTMNVEMRIITEDNVEQLTGMAYSNNYNKLVGDPNISLIDIINKANKQAPKTDKEVKKYERNKEESPKYKRERAEENLDKYTSLGWLYHKLDDEGDEVYKSIIQKLDGRASEYWNISGHDYRFPDRFPKGWIKDDLINDDGTSKNEADIITKLIANQIPNNWDIIVKNAPTYQVASPAYKPTSDSESVSPVYQPASPAYQPTSPLYEARTPSGTPPERSASPPYNPTTPPVESVSPPYNPTSPVAYVSPPYNPTTPPVESASALPSEPTAINQPVPMLPSAQSNIPIPLNPNVNPSFLKVADAGTLPNIPEIITAVKNKNTENILTSISQDETKKDNTSKKLTKTIKIKKNNKIETELNI